MIYSSPADWLECEHRRVLLFGMSGVGKTHASSLLMRTRKWFHYSIDYRIGTRYMNEFIVDNFKREAMRNPFLADLLLSDSIYIASNISFGNLSPLSTYLGKPGDRQLGGIDIDQFRKRQDQHRHAEVSALRDTTRFIERSQEIYGYRHFVCDSGGSICEVVDPEDRQDELLTVLSENMLLIWIRSDEEHSEKLVERFKASPKPMYYRPEFLDEQWNDFTTSRGLSGDEVNPDAFACWCYSKALERRLPLYEAMARNWGMSLEAGEVAGVTSEDEFCNLVAIGLERRQAELSELSSNAD